MNAMHTMFAGTTQCVAVVGIRGPFEEEKLRGALAEIRERYEILSCTIHFEEGVPYFVRDDRPTVVCVREDAGWRAVYQSLNSVPLPLEPPPWAIHIVLRRDDPEAWELLLVAHHAIMDGHSIAVFMGELLTCYAHRLRTGHGPPTRPPRPLAPPAETMLPRALTWQEFEVRRARSAERQPKIEPDPHRELAPIARRSTRTRFFRLATSAVTAIEGAASENGTTLNSWIAACLLRGIEEHSPGRTSFALGTAFSLRALCDAIAADDLGCHLSVLSTYHDRVPERSVAERAREHVRALARAVMESARHPATVDHAALARSLEPLRSIGAFVGDGAYTYAESALARDYPPLRVAHFFASANRALGSASIVLHGLRQGGAIYFTVNHTSPLQSETWVAAVTTTFADVLASSIADKLASSGLGLDSGRLEELF